MDICVKIISDAADEILAPIGVMRKGRSRFYYDDNGFFAVGIEFQPSGYEKGTYLNVGVDFLWNNSSDEADIGFGCYYDGISARLHLPDGKEYASAADGEEQFRENVGKFALIAKEKVLEYRNFADYDYGHKRLIGKAEKSNNFWNSYHAAMYCFLFGDYKNGYRLFDVFLDMLKADDRDRAKAFYGKCRREFLPRLTDVKSAQNAVIEMIAEKRRGISEKSGYKNFAPEFDITPFGGA